jgi:hypothetical protein
LSIRVSPVALVAFAYVFGTDHYCGVWYWAHL